MRAMSMDTSSFLKSDIQQIRPNQPNFQWHVRRILIYLREDIQQKRLNQRTGGNSIRSLVEIPNYCGIIYIFWALRRTEL